MSDLVQQVASAVDARRDSIIETLCDLIRINTVNPYSGGTLLGSEKPGQAYLAPRLESLGFETRRVAVSNDVYSRAGIIGPADRDFTDRPNLVATLDFDRPGPHVLVFGHMDTVAVDDMTIDPFDPVRRDGKVFGRGASDDKSGLALAWGAVDALLSLALPLGGRLTVASVVEEECNGGGAGILAVLLEGMAPDVAVCVDGYGDYVGRGCAGVVTGRVLVPGVAAHAAGPSGVSALEKALVVKRSLDAFKTEREARRPLGLLNIGVFRAGVHPAVVPGAAEMEFNLVYFLDEAQAAKDAGLGFSAALLRRELEERIAEAAKGDVFLADHPPEVIWVKDLPPFETSEDSALLKEVCDAHHAVTGEAPTVKMMNGWSDASHVPLVAGCEVVNLGASAADAAHAPVEYVEEEVLIRVTKTLAIYLGKTFAKETP